MLFIIVDTIFIIVDRVGFCADTLFIIVDRDGLRKIYWIGKKKTIPHTKKQCWLTLLSKINYVKIYEKNKH